VLIVTGSNDGRDWWRNFRTVGASWPETGDSGRKYHGGHLRGARELWGWMNLKSSYEWYKKVQSGEPDHGRWDTYRSSITATIGHSRGGAIASILATSLNIPCITFATPPCVYGRDRLPGDAGVINFCRADDLICHAPPWLHRVGHTAWLDAPRRWLRASHSMQHYAPYLEAVSS
jgi:hypothetical protein